MTIIQQILQFACGMLCGYSIHSAITHYRGWRRCRQADPILYGGGR